jgi:ADP-ribosyl-[dinitrogen reductase] hydrolase
MSLASTGAGGRGTQAGSIVGDVILKGKKKFWGVSGTHYHRGMKAGENTLNALCARVLMRSMTGAKAYSQPSFLRDYVAFMTEPDTHNDTYAESYHRDFFSNWALGVAPEKCAGPEKHDTPSVGGFVTLPPLVIASLDLPEDDFARTIKSHLFLTHKSESLATYAQLYATLLRDVLKGADLRASAQATGMRLGLNMEEILSRGLPDNEVVGGMFGNACYISDSFPCVLYLAVKYAESMEDGLLANTNAGGECCHRGSVLGSLLGAALGTRTTPDALIQGLSAHASLQVEIEAFSEAFCGDAK